MKIISNKICIIAPSLQMGGIERELTILANFFVDKGYEVYYITLLNLEPFFLLDDRVKLISSPFEFNREKSILKYLSFYIKVFSPFNGYLRNKIKEIGPDVIMCFGDVFPQLCLISFFKIKIPFYISNRSSPNINYNIYFEIFRRLGYLIQKPTGVFAQTSYAAERKFKILGSDANIKIIPNPAREIIEYNVKKENWVVAVGRLHKEKGFDRLIRAFSTVNAPDWKLIIAGTGIHEIEIKKIAKEYNLDDRVSFLGKVENIDMLLSQSKIFVLPSYREGFPNALCEAMAAGLPCISFDIIAGPRDIINDGVDGFLIKDGDIPDMANKIQYLIDHKVVRDKIGLEEKKIINRLSIDNVGQLYLNCFF